MGTQRPGDAGLVKHLRITDEPVHMGLCKEVGRWGDEEYVSALFIEGKANGDASVVFDIFLESLQGIGQRRLG